MHERRLHTKAAPRTGGADSWAPVTDVFDGSSFGLRSAVRTTVDSHLYNSLVEIDVVARLRR